MESIKKPTKEEINLIGLLIEISSLSIATDWKETLLVRSMDDGKMGSLLLFPKGGMETEREFGNQIAEYIFKDEDGVEVIASLNIDTHRDLFELDLWKTDYSRLIRYPLL